jgi:hypothetical protein
MFDPFRVERVLRLFAAELVTIAAFSDIWMRGMVTHPSTYRAITGHFYRLFNLVHFNSGFSFIGFPKAVFLSTLVFVNDFAEFSFCIGRFK